VFFVIESFSGHKRFWTYGIGYASLRREVVQEFHGGENNVDGEKFRDPIEGKAVSR
jgi:hypothetical protein